MSVLNELRAAIAEPGIKGALAQQLHDITEQYNDGMVRDLQNLQLEYLNADQAHKDAIRSIVLHRFSVYDQNKLPPDLWNFYRRRNYEPPFRLHLTS